MRVHNKAIGMVLAAVLIDTIGFGIVIPVFPALLTGLGHTDIEHATRLAGYMLVVYAGAQFIAGPVLGNLSDRFGRRPVLIASMLSFGIDYAVMALAPSIAWLFLGRVIAGAAGAVYGPAGSVVADVMPAEKRGGAFALIGAMFGLGFIIGPAIGGLLSVWGPRAPFYAAATLALVNALVMLVAMPETLAREHRRPFRLRDAHVIGAFRPLFHAGHAAPLLVAVFLWQLAQMVYPATWSFWATARFGWDATAIGWSLAFVGLTATIVQGGLTGPAIARFGERKAVLIGVVAGGLSFLAFSVVTASWQVYVLFCTSALSGLAMAAMQAMLSGMVDATRQGQLQGGLGAMGSVTEIIGPLLLTQVLAWGIDHRFPGVSFLIAGVLALACAVIVMTRVRVTAIPPEPTHDTA